MVSPLDPFFEAFASDPATGILLGAVAVLMLLGPEALLATLYLRPVLARKMRKDYLASVEGGEWDAVIVRATGPLATQVQELKELVKGEELEAKIGAVETRLGELDQALETRLEELKESVQADTIKAKLDEIDVALGQHLQALYDQVEGLPAQIKTSSEMSVQGAKGVEMREIYKAANAAEEDLAEMYVADLDPTERIAARLESMEPSEDYIKKHPNGAMIIRGVRDMIVEGMQNRSGVINMKRVGGSRSSEFGG